MSTLKLNAYGEFKDSEQLIQDLFTYIVDGGLEDQLVDTLSNEKRIVNMSNWSQEAKEVSFEVIPILKISQESAIDHEGDILGLSVRIDDANLVFDLRYGGGCKEHKFELTWDGAYLKSIPPQINLNFKHSNEGDSCKAIKTKKIAFSLKDIEPCKINLFVNGVQRNFELDYAA